MAKLGMHGFAAEDGWGTLTGTLSTGSGLEQRACTGQTGASLWLIGEESACNARDPGSVPESRRSPGEGNGNPLQYSCLGNSMGREAVGLQRVRCDLATGQSIENLCLFIFFSRSLLPSSLGNLVTVGQWQPDRCLNFEEESPSL